VVVIVGATAGRPHMKLQIVQIHLPNIIPTKPFRVILSEVEESLRRLPIIHLPVTGGRPYTTAALRRSDTNYLVRIPSSPQHAFICRIAVKTLDKRGGGGGFNKINKFFIKKINKKKFKNKFF
jgi:hypothetical protein